MHIFRFTLVAFSLLALFAGVLISNMWRLMPELHELDAVISVPLHTQIALLIFAALLGAPLCNKNSTFKTLPLYSVVFMLCLASWYQINLSKNNNALTVSMFPVYQKTIELDELKTVKVDNRKIFVDTTSSPITIFTGIYPLGFDLDIANQALTAYGRCVHQVKENCIEIGFN